MARVENLLLSTRPKRPCILNRYEDIEDNDEDDFVDFDVWLARDDAKKSQVPITEQLMKLPDGSLRVSLDEEGKTNVTLFASRKGRTYLFPSGKYITATKNAQ